MEIFAPILCMALTIGTGITLLVWIYRNV